MEKTDSRPETGGTDNWAQALSTLGLPAEQADALTRAHEKEVNERADTLRAEYEKRLTDSTGEYTRRLRHMALMDALEKEGVREKELRLLLEKSADETLITEKEDGLFDASGAADMLKDRYPACFRAPENTRISPPLSPVNTDPNDPDDSAYYRAVFEKERRKSV